MSNDNTTKTRPTHRVYAVTKRGEKTYSLPIGALWPHKDGKGFTQKLDYLPLNGAKIMIRAIDEQGETVSEPMAETQPRAEIVGEIIADATA